MTNWFAPTAAWLNNSISAVILGRVEQTDAQGSNTSLPTDKASYAVQNVVNRVRGAIGKGNRTPLSATAMSVPPEGVQFTLALVGECLIASCPNMGWSITPIYETILKDAKEWIKELSKGEPTDYPTDPQNTDASGNQVGVAGASGGFMTGEVYLGTGGLFNEPYVPPVPVGNTGYSGYVAPNGLVTGNTGDQFLLYSSENFQLVSIWSKGGSSGTNTGWFVIQTVGIE